MSEQAIIDMLYNAFLTALKLALPLLLASLTVGLVVSIFMAATQIQEMTLTFVPKLLLIGVLLVILAPWMMTSFREFVREHFMFLVNSLR